MKMRFTLTLLISIAACNHDPLSVPVEDSAVAGDAAMLQGRDSGIDAALATGVDLAQATDLWSPPDFSFACGALFCPNSNSRAVAKAEMDLDPPFGVTVEAWVYPTSPHQNTYGGTIASHLSGPVAQSVGGYLLQLDPYDKIAFQIGLSDGTTMTVTSQAPVTLNAWSHVAGVLDTAAQRVSVFIDGRLSASKPTTATLRAQPAAGLSLCNYEAATLQDPSNFLGAISWLRISRGARYTMSFVPERTFAMDVYTIALYSCAAVVNGVSVADSSGSMNSAFLFDGAYVGQPPLCP